MGVWCEKKLLLVFVTDSKECQQPSQLVGSFPSGLRRVGSGCGKVRMKGKIGRGKERIETQQRFPTRNR